MTSPRGQVATREPDHPVDITKPLTSVQDALYVADVLSRSELVPYSMRGRASSIFHVIVTGQSLGLHWIEALRVIYSPGAGQIGLRGAFLLSQLHKAGHDYDWTEGEDWCEFTLKRHDRDKPYVAKYTLEMAIQGGLAKRLDDGRLVAMSRDSKPLPWMLFTSSMLFWRAVSLCVVRGAPEVSLGFEIENDLPEPPPEVHLQVAPNPGPPAPPEAATEDGRAAQAEALRELDRQHGGNPDVGGPGDPEPVEDSQVGGTSGPEPVQEGEAQWVGRDFAGPASDGAGMDTSTAPTAVTATGEAQGPETDAPMDRDLPEDSARRGKEEALGELFTKLGWAPRRYRGEVLKACSMFVGRRITGVGDLKAAEVMSLSSALSKILRKKPPEPAVALLDEVEKWEQKWREHDPDGLAEYEGAL